MKLTRTLEQADIYVVCDFLHSYFSLFYKMYFIKWFITYSAILWHLSFQTFSIDATKTPNRLCHFINDSSIKDRSCNATMKLKVFKDYPRLCLFALRQIKAGNEIRYDYGEDRRLLFWRKEVPRHVSLFRIFQL